ncbi:isochorismatase [Deinococcus alpinitundrae]|uniref:isochorismatase n=1 Tax=Deinococcus alpinitundrae TaxID=468913 RepID=UPI00137A5247|nr:isochorismatase [Deinococcus alpinitundrae]
MSPPVQALLLLDAQRARHRALEDRDPRAADARLLPWRAAVSQARSQGVLVVFVQRDGEVGSDLEPLTRGWTLHPDFRVEERDVLLRVTADDAFERSALTLELRSRGIGHLKVLALPGSAADVPTRAGAQRAGLSVIEIALPLEVQP